MPQDFQNFINKCMPYLQLMRFDKPIGIALLLWPILWALWIAGEGHPPIWIVFVFVAGVVIMRATGCVINDIWDRELDKHVPRTKNRPLASGKVTVREAVILVVVLLLIAAVLVLSLNLYTILLAFAGLLGAIIYPYMKRITYYPQVVLGLVFNWGILMVFAAINDSLSTTAGLLLVTALLWTLAYDTLYAIADRKADIKLGIKSTAILLGDMDRVAVGTLQVLFLLGLALVGRQAHLTLYFYLGLLVALGLFVYEWWLIRDRDPDACFAAFKHNHWIGLVIFIAILMGMP